MRKKNLNSINVSGRIYSFGENGRNMLELKVSGPGSKNPGTEFISGTINVATDEAGLNVVPVHFSYVTAVYGQSGKANPNFATLKKIIADGNAKTWVEAGKDGATKLKIDGALALNEWWTKENDEDRLVSTKVNEGSFINIVNELPAEDERTKFTVDMLITRVNHIDADDDKIKEDYDVLGGAIFNFRNEILPMELLVRNPQGMKYFESLDPDEPTFTKVWGKINCSTTVNTITEKSAFGEASVRTFERKVREWVVTGCSTAGYEYGNEEVLTAEDIQKAMGDREVMLAEQKKRSEEAKAKNAQVTATPAAPKAKVGGFNF